MQTDEQKDLSIQPAESLELKDFLTTSVFIQDTSVWVCLPPISHMTVPNSVHHSIFVRRTPIWSSSGDLVADDGQQ